MQDKILGIFGIIFIVIAISVIVGEYYFISTKVNLLEKGMTKASEKANLSEEITKASEEMTKASEKEINSCKIIRINGVELYKEISYEGCIILYVNGVNNIVKINEGIAKEVHVNGVNNTVNLLNCDAKVVENGIRNKIVCWEN